MTRRREASTRSGALAPGASRSSKDWRGGLIAVALFSATPAVAENLVLNPDFDTGLTPWTQAFGDVVEWVELEGDGAMRITETTVGQTSRSRQLIRVTAGSKLTLSGCGYIESGQTGIGYFIIGANFAPVDCPQFGDVFGPLSLGLVSAPLDEWVCSDLAFTVPETAQCAEVVLFIRDNMAAGPFRVHFDEIFLPEPDGLPLSLVACVTLAALARSRRSVADSRWRRRQPGCSRSRSSHGFALGATVARRPST
jgi:hypothetical protein